MILLRCSPSIAVMLGARLAPFTGLLWLMPADAIAIDCGFDRQPPVAPLVWSLDPALSGEPALKY